MLWSTLATIGGVVVYYAFNLITGLEVALIGIPVGLAIGNASYHASGKRGGRRFQVLAVVLAYLAFSLTYAPGMFGIAFKGGLSIPAFVFAVLITLVSPLLDANSGWLGRSMVLAGMYLAWSLAGSRKTD